MKKPLIISLIAAAGVALSLPAQERGAARAGRAASPAAATGDYTADVGVVSDAQGQALEQARAALENEESARNRANLATAIKEMERSHAALEQARKSPDKLPAALAAEQAAYQALLKATPREHRVSRSRNRGQQGSSAGQPGQEELDQLEMTPEENRYETERQASATPTAQQKEQSQTVDRLKQLARRQQDLNDRLRELQTALQEAPTQKAREEIQRQLKRLRDEERQLLSDVDELRQRLEQSPEAARQADARQQLDQTRTDVQRAAQDLERQSVSEALAAGSRAEERLQNLRESLRQQTSSQFAEQMRRMRTQARDLANRESEIARGLDELNNSARKSLDDSAERQKLTEQLARQQSGLTNLLGGMQAVTEQAESTEPLLSKQLYDILRKADQTHTGNQLEISERLVDRGFLPQASQAERGARQNLEELRQSVEHAAESVLGSEAEALRYAQKELEDLARQMAGEIAAGTNAGAAAAQPGPRGPGRTNPLASAAGGLTNGPGALRGTNDLGSAGERRSPGDARSGQKGSRAAAQETAQVGGTAGQPGRERGAQASTPSIQSTASTGSTPDNEEAVQNPGPEGQRSGGQRGGGRGDGEQRRDAAATEDGERRDAAATEGEGRPDAAAGGRDRLRQYAQDLGGAHGGLGLNGPITGNSFVDWTERMRDVEQAIDSQDVRNQLATVRERVGAYRRNYREDRRTPPAEELRNKVLAPLTLARDWVGQELSRAQSDRSLVPLDRDPVQDKYADLVRQYYEKLGSAQ